jgi:hypothetical protein
MVLPGAAHDLGALDAADIASLIGSVTTAGPPSRALYIGV